MDSMSLPKPIASPLANELAPSLATPSSKGIIRFGRFL
jgi:hypothetical protein